jgi:hypothetical protein
LHNPKPKESPSPIFWGVLGAPDPGEPLSNLNISANSDSDSKIILEINQGPCGGGIHEKKPEAKNRMLLSLSKLFVDFSGKNKHRKLLRNTAM